MLLLENGKKKTTNRIYYLDCLRVIACLSVIMLHASSLYVKKDFGTLNFWIGNILNSLTRVGVPIFVMLSGALLLDKDYDYTPKKLIKKITKMIFFYIFWSTVYSIAIQIISPDLVRSKTGGSVMKNILFFIGTFIQGYYHLWFVYLIIGLYLIVPLLRLWVNDENKKQVEYFIVLSIIFTYAIPQIISIVSNYCAPFSILKDVVENKLCMEYIGGFTTYFILGWYMHNYNIKINGDVCTLGILSLYITILGTYILSSSTGRAIQMYDELGLNVLLQSLVVFGGVKALFINKEHINNKFVSMISKNSLGIYAMHAIVVDFMYKILSKNGFEIAIINIPVVFMISFIVSFAGTYLFSKIPILKKVV